MTAAPLLPSVALQVRSSFLFVFAHSLHLAQGFPLIHVRSMALLKETLWPLSL